MVFEEEDVYPLAKVFAETVTSPFLIAFILWLHDSYPEDAWIHFKHIKAIYVERCNSIFSLKRLSLNLCHRTRTKSRKKNKRDKERELLKAYGDPTKPGSLGGASHFARIHRLKPAEAQKILEKDVAYTLNRPRRHERFATLHVLVFGKDEQWVLDLAEMQPLAKYNSGNRYLLVVVDAF